MIKFCSLTLNTVLTSVIKEFPYKNDLRKSGSVVTTILRNYQVNYDLIIMRKLVFSVHKRIVQTVQDCQANYRYYANKNIGSRSSLTFRAHFALEFFGQLVRLKVPLKYLPIGWEEPQFTFPQSENADGRFWDHLWSGDYRISGQMN